MSPEEYLARLQAQLKGLPASQQAELLAEIRDHLQESQANSLPEPGIGSPEELGRRFQQVHRRNRWLDYLLVVLPELVLMPLLNLLLIWFLPGARGAAFDPIYQHWGIRAAFLLELLLCLAALRRFQRYREPGLSIYWLNQVLWSAVAILLRGGAWPASPSLSQIIETGFWCVVILLSGAAIVSLVLHSRDTQAAVLALLPLCLAAGNWSTGQLLLQERLAHGYSLPQLTLFYFGPTQWGQLLWPALYFLTTRRALRWCGLLLFAAPLALLNLVASVTYPLLAILWSLPLLLVLVTWALEWRTHLPRQPMAG